MPTSALSCCFCALLMFFIPVVVLGGSVFPVKRRLVNPSLHDMRKHDIRRRAGRHLAAIDFPLEGHIFSSMYYTELAIGTPPKNFTLQVDTGSHDMWVPCKSCKGCFPENKTSGVPFQSYDPSASMSARIVRVGEAPCESSGQEETGRCHFGIQYKDNTSVYGYYVKDLISFNNVSGDHQTRPFRENIIFGCITNEIAEKKLKDIYLDKGVEGLIGFGGSPTSVISQLASSGKGRRVFAHCLNTVKAGGVFAIGKVVQPQVQTTKLVPVNHSVYGAHMTAVEVGHKVMELKSLHVHSVAIIDSGSTTGFIPHAMHEYLMDQILSNHSDLKLLRDPGHFTCLTYYGSVDEGFPSITFHFDMSLLLRLHPRDYILRRKKDTWCVAWGTCPNEEGFIFGDLFLQNKLVVYDLEKRVIGWREYDCSKSIQVKDDTSGKFFKIDSHGDAALKFSTLTR